MLEGSEFGMTYRRKILVILELFQIVSFILLDRLMKIGFWEMQSTLIHIRVYIIPTWSYFALHCAIIDS